MLIASYLFRFPYLSSIISTFILYYLLVNHSETDDDVYLNFVGLTFT